MPKDTRERTIDSGLLVRGGAGASGGGVGALPYHDTLPGLNDGDPHIRYLDVARGDARYYTETEVDAWRAAHLVPNAHHAPVTVSAPLTVDAAQALALTLGTGLEVSASALRIKRPTNSGLALDASGLALGTPSGLSVSSTNSLTTTTHAHAVASSADPDAAASLLATSAAGLLTLRNGAFRQAAHSYDTFASGFAGSGWRVDYGITTAGKATAEFDDLTVRGQMRVYEMLIQQIRATNGSLFVSSGSKVVSVTAATTPAWTVNGAALTFNGAAAVFNATLYTINTAAAGDSSRELYHGFLYSDLIAAQQVRWNGSAFAGLISSKLEVTRVDSLTQYGAALVEGDAPAAGYDYVRRGSTVDTNRRGAIYLTSDDSNAPFIDILDGLASHADWGSAGVARVRLGKLTGINDGAFGGVLSGYGLYANRAYIKGTVVVTGGSLGGLAAADVNSNTTTIDGGQITTGTITAAKLTVSTLSAITANLGGVTAGSIVVGSANKLWLNDSADGGLAIGGSTKSAAPFQVSAAGHLDAIDASFGTMQIDSNGCYVAPLTTFNSNYGYKFRYGANVGAGLFGSYQSSTAAQTWLLNNTTINGAAVDASADATLTLRSMAGSAKVGAIDLRAERIVSGSAKFTGISLLNTSVARKATVHADTFIISPEAGGEYTIWHSNNDGPDSGLNADTVDGKHASDFAWVGNNNTFSYETTFVGATNFGSYLRLSPLTSAPAYQAGYALIFLLNAGSNSYQLRTKIRSADSLRQIDAQLATT